MAHFSKDEKLINAMKGGLDVMTDVAAAITGKSYENVSKKEREKAKSVIYGMIYGQTYHSLATDLEISRKDAKEFIDKFKFCLFFFYFFFLFIF